MPDIRLYQNAALSSPVDADIIFTAQSGSSPQWIESKTTMSQLASYIATKITGGITANCVFVSTRGSDTSGTGSFAAPFATRARALTYIGSSATSSNPYVILYDAGSYTVDTFYIYPNIYDVSLAAALLNNFTGANQPSPVSFFVNTGNMVQDASWNGKNANYYVFGIDFQTAVNVDFTALSGVTANLNFSNCTLPSNINFTGTNNTISVNLVNIWGEGDLVAVNLANINGIGCNFVTDVERNVAGTTNANFYSNINLNMLNMYVSAGTLQGVVYTSPCTSVNLTRTGGTLTYTTDAISYQAPTISGSVTFTRSTPSDAIASNYTPSHYTATAATVKGNLQGIDNALAPLSGTNNAAFLTNSSGVGSLYGNAVLGSTATVYGKGAGANLNSASTNNITAIGEEAGATVASAPANASNSTFVGYQAGKAYTTSGTANDGNTAVGYQALLSGTTCSANTAIGYQSLLQTTTSLRNVAIGWGAGSQLTTGSGQNVYVGLFAGEGAVGQTSSNNVAVGYEALIGVTSGHDNVVHGYIAAPTLTTGFNNVVIGSGANVDSANAQNEIVIGAGATGAGNNVAVIGNSSITNLVSGSTSGGCSLGSSNNPYGFLYLGTATNYVSLGVNTQSNVGANINIPDAGSSSVSLAFRNVTAVTTTSQTMVKWFTYFANNAAQVVFTLPATISQGDTFEVIGQGAGGWKIDQPTGVSIKLNANLSTTTGTSGFLASTDQYDTVKLVAESSTVLVVEYVKGNLVTDSGAVFNALNTNNPSTPVTVSGTSKTFALSDAGTLQVCSNAATQTLTVPTNASVAFALGTKIDLFQQGAGQVVIAAAGGVTIQSKSGNLKLAAQYSGATLTFLGSNTWSLVGDLTA